MAKVTRGQYDDIVVVVFLLLDEDKSKGKIDAQMCHFIIIAKVVQEPYYLFPASRELFHRIICSLLDISAVNYQKQQEAKFYLLLVLVFIHRS